MKEKIILSCNGSAIEGCFCDPGNTLSLVIIINGHNGFYNYGMFPYIQQKLYENGISSYSFNFSHGGIIGNADFFEDLVKYEQNCMRLEMEDVLCVLKNFPGFKMFSNVYLLAHSLGGIPSIFAARWAADNKIDINGIILLSSVSKLNFWPYKMIEEWKVSGVYHKKNNRTKQDLPLGKEFLDEILNCEEKWNVKKEINLLTIPILIIHGEKDEAVPVEHGRALFESVSSLNTDSSLKIIPEASHTFDTKHPFDGASPQVDEMINNVINWIQVH